MRKKKELTVFEKVQKVGRLLLTIPGVELGFVRVSPGEEDDSFDVQCRCCEESIEVRIPPKKQRVEFVFKHTRGCPVMLAARAAEREDPQSCVKWVTLSQALITRRESALNN